MNPHFRSALFTPATRPDRFAKAAAVSADLLMRCTARQGQRSSYPLEPLAQPFGQAMARMLNLI
jgi:hypothetical protein